MSTFLTRQVIIPPSPPLHPFDSASDAEGERHGKKGMVGIESIPALPDSLMSALARDPPPLSTNTSSPSSYEPTSAPVDVPLPVTPKSHRLPQLPVYSPIVNPFASAPPRSPTQNEIISSRSTSGLVGSAKKIFRMKSKTNLLDEVTNPIQAESATSRSGSPSSSTKANGSALPKRSVWKSVAFGGKLKSTSDLPSSLSSSTSKVDLTTSSSTTSSIDHPNRPGLKRTTSTSSSVLRLGDDAISGSKLTRSNSKYDLPVHDESEVERLELKVEQAAARRASKIGGGRGIDKELDDMDFEAKRGRVSIDNGAIPWRGRTERYTLDLKEGEGYESEGEDGGVMAELHPRKSSNVDESVSSALLARRRNTAASVKNNVLEVPPISIPLPSTIVEAGPHTAPLVPSVSRTSVESIRLSESKGNRSMSEGDLAFGVKSSEEELAAGLGLSIHAPTPAGSQTGNKLHRSSTADFVIAVVGARGVGKSTVIRKGMKRPLTKPSIVLQDAKENRATTSISQLNISGTSRSVEVLEVDMALLKYDAEGVIWPLELPVLDGVMLCYDATDSLALSSLSVLLHAFWSRSSDTPLIVLACKASRDDSTLAISTNRAADICNVYGAGIVALDGGIEDPERKMKNSFNWMIREIGVNRGEIRRSSVESVASTSSAPISRRESRESATARSTVPTPATPLLPPLPKKQTVIDHAPIFADPFTGASISQHNSMTSSGVRRKSSEIEVVQDALLDSVLTPPVNAPVAKVVVDEAKSLDMHFSPEDLIDKLLFASVTGNDEQYVTLFLIIYRRFAKPYDVLEKLIERFEFVGGRLKTDPLLSRFAQMKLCGILSIWFQAYPGDFTSSSTFNLLRAFLESLLPRGVTWVAHYAAELLPLLRAVSRMDDLDSGWGLPDEIVAPLTPVDVIPTLLRRPSLAPSYGSNATTDVMLGNDNRSHLSIPGENSLHDSTTESEHRRSGSDYGTVATNSDSNGPTPSLNTNSGVTKRGQVATLLRWSNILIDLPEEAVAVQITRIAWEAFSEITPRDLIRHVLGPRPKTPQTSIREGGNHVMRSINFVNYLADWVASMLLVQSKLKYRVRLIEKFIGIACRLREQENFDSLMAILAGLSSQPIFRLSETTEAVNLKLEGDRLQVPKRLRSLNKLMSSNRSFAAYRLALASSGAYMIPYLGVHLQEITLVNEVKKSSTDGQVNWSKFQQMSRSAAIVLDCSRLTPQLPVDLNIEKCIMTSVLDIDAQYALSYTHQPRAQSSSSGGGGRTVMRKIMTTLTSV